MSGIFEEFADISSRIPPEAGDKKESAVKSAWEQEIIALLKDNNRLLKKLVKLEKRNKKSHSGIKVPSFAEWGAILRKAFPAILAFVTAIIGRKSTLKSSPRVGRTCTC